LVDKAFSLSSLKKMSRGTIISCPYDRFIENEEANENDNHLHEAREVFEF
jgi:hypothetical protein